MTLRLLRRAVSLMAVLSFLVATAACSIDVQDQDSSPRQAEIRTPVGDVSVRAAEGPADTGLPTYPGATLLRERDEPESANVNVGAFGFGVQVAASKFESPDGEAAILGFYRTAMAQYGTITECRGNVDFKDNGPVCRSSALGREMQLVTGTKNDQRIVVVKPRGAGSEIALVHVQLRGV